MVKIIRNSETAGRYVSYRLVVWKKRKSYIRGHVRLSCWALQHATTASAIASIYWGYIGEDTVEMYIMKNLIVRWRNNLLNERLCSTRVNTSLIQKKCVMSFFFKKKCSSHLSIPLSFICILYFLYTKITIKKIKSVWILLFMCVFR